MEPTTLRQQLLERIASESSITATAIQTVGQKGHDGFAIVRVDSSPATAYQ